VRLKVKFVQWTRVNVDFAVTVSLEDLAIKLGREGGREKKALDFSLLPFQ
jgi:hypothetical protein